MTRSSTRFALVLVTVAALCCLRGTPAAGQPIREVVEAGNRAFKEAFLRGDSRAVAALYTEDAKVIAPGSEIASGRPAIAALWQKVIDTGVKDLTISTTAVEAAQDFAYEDGIVKLVAADGKTTTGRYLVVWRQTKEGWKLHRDIWN